MALWMYITNSENWNITKKTNLLGAARQRNNGALFRVQKGDKCLIYVKGGKSDHEITEPEIVGEYEIVSQVFVQHTKLFHAPPTAPKQVYELRVGLRPLRIFDRPIEFKPLIPKLTFIKNKERWSLRIRGRALVELPKIDYDLVTSALH
jgi:predicted RNA-binding protein